MASPGSGHLPPLGELSLSNSSLIKQVESAKQELAHHFQHYHRLLNAKYGLMLAQLDAVLSSANALYKKRTELRETQGDLEERIRSNEFSAMKSKMLSLLLVEMSELERSISRSERESVQLAWKDSQLEAAIEESCVVSQIDPQPQSVVVASDTPPVDTSVSYADRQVPVWSVGSSGDGDGQMKNPKGIAIETKDIYIADRDNNQIAVFNRNGKFQ